MLEVILLKVVRLLCLFVMFKNDFFFFMFIMKEIVFGYEYWFRIVLYNRKKFVWIVKIGKFFFIIDKFLVIICVFNDKVLKIVYS